MYGFRFLGIGNSKDEHAPSIWEHVQVSVSFAMSEELDASQPPIAISANAASLTLAEGKLDIKRLPCPSVTFTLHRSLPDEAFVHPYLSFPAAVLNHWRGRTSLHAGAVVTERGCIALLGSKESGKSTTMAAAAANGETVLTDDLLVIDGTAAFAGPRCIDLRADSTAHFGGRPLGVIGARERWRLDLGPSPMSSPICAFVRLAWGERVNVRPMSISEKIETMVANTALGCGPATNDGFLKLLGVPFFEVSRPRDFVRLPEFLDALRELG